MDILSVRGTSGKMPELQVFRMKCNAMVLFKILRVGSLLLAIFVASLGCQPVAEQGGAGAKLDPSLISGVRAFEDVRQLVAITPRHSGSDGCVKAAEHLQKALEQYTDSCEIDVFEDAVRLGSISFRNVVGVLQGSGSDIIILASHYDTKSGISDTFQGANDSGSSSGLLIELTRVLHKQKPLPFTVIFAFFDGEECMNAYGKTDGLHGSRRFVQQLDEKGKLDDIKAMILLDMIGDRDLTVTIPRNVDKTLRKIAFDAARSAGVRKKFTLSRGAIIDDHVPFVEAGIPSINLIDFNFGSRPGLNDYWHTEEDNLEKICPESLQSIGEVVIHMLNALGE